MRPTDRLRNSGKCATPEWKVLGTAALRFGAKKDVEAKSPGVGLW